MVSQTQRLRTSEVVEVLKHGRGLPSGVYLSAKVFYPAEPANVTIRCAAVISKKVAKTAVVRNRVRRAVYDAMRAVSLEQQATNFKPARFVIFVRVIPKDNLRAAFAVDIKKLLSSKLPSPRDNR